MEHQRRGPPPRPGTHQTRRRLQGHRQPAELNEIYASHGLLANRTFGYGHSFGVLSHYYGREAGLELREDIDTVLEPGMVVSMEPIITVLDGQPGAGGYREHDILVVGEDGAENITKFPFGPSTTSSAPNTWENRACPPPPSVVTKAWVLAALGLVMTSGGRRARPPRFRVANGPEAQQRRNIVNTMTPPATPAHPAPASGGPEGKDAGNGDARGASVIVNAVAVLRSFTADEPMLGVTEIASRVGMHKSTVSRILATFEQEHLVERDPDTAVPAGPGPHRGGRAPAGGAGRAPGGLSRPAGTG